jgi:hypothetical protein
MLNPVGPNAKELALSQLSERYANTTKAYAALQSAGHFSLRVEPDATDKVFGDWVKATLS